MRAALLLYVVSEKLQLPVAGMIFGVPAEQQQCATCFFSPNFFFQLMEIRRSDRKL